MSDERNGAVREVGVGRLLVLGDIHGAHRALVQVLERANVDRERDRIVFVGDVADGWPETRQCMDELLTLKHLTFILGNHDEWFRRWTRTGWMQPLWTTQGGRATLGSYGSSDPREVPPEHKMLLNHAKHWHQDGDRIFVHAGWRTMHEHPMAESPDVLMWDRDLWAKARQRAEGDKHRLTKFSEVYIGHTTTEQYSDKPVRACEVWNVDQGCGWAGRLTLMDVDTKEYWQADPSTELYPGIGGRFAANSPGAA